MRWLLLLLVSVMAACTSHPPIRTEANVDIPRFMGAWHVHGHIPFLIDGEAYKQTETYQFEAPNIVRTTFQFNDGSPNGPLKTYTPTGYIDLASGGGVWAMQFLWPIKAEYRIVYVDSDYSETIIGRSARDLVWIMSRKPTMSDDDYARLLAMAKAEGYDVSEVRRVPTAD
jgi:apolipoprotein D and lipocalin family protein